MARYPNQVVTYRVSFRGREYVKKSTKLITHAAFYQYSNHVGIEWCQSETAAYAKRRRLNTLPPSPPDAVLPVTSNRK